MASQEFFDTLLFSYGQGTCLLQGRRYRGEIVLSRHKLYLRDNSGDIAKTFIPLEKVFKVRVFWGRMWVYARPSTFMQFVAVVCGRPGRIRALMRDLADHRQLQKRRFGLEWVDPDEYVP